MAARCAGTMNILYNMKYCLLSLYKQLIYWLSKVSCSGV